MARHEKQVGRVLMVRNPSEMVSVSLLATLIDRLTCTNGVLTAQMAASASPPLHPNAPVQTLAVHPSAPIK
jgi:hypothetical protein